MSDEKIICSFTGHRPRTFDFGYDETDPRFVRLYSTLKSQIIQLCNAGCRDFYTGMAEGVDLWCAEIVLDLKEKYYNDIRLFPVIPYLMQMQGMSPAFAARYRRAMEDSAGRFLVAKEYHKGCFMKRNKYLASTCTVLLAVLKNGEERSGTGQTINFARSLSKRIIIINV